MGRPTKLELDQVLTRATRLFWAQGTDAVSTRDLEQAIGIRAPAIYRRFRSKHELLARCIDHYVDTIIAGRIRGKLDDAEDPLRGLHDFFTSALEPHGRRRFRGCLLANTATNADSQVPVVHAAIDRGLRVTQSALQQQIVRAQQAGQVDGDLDPGAVGQALVMSLQGLLALVRHGEPDLRPGIDATFRLLGVMPKAQRN